MAGSSGFFSDPAVQQELLNDGFDVQETPLGSLEICKVPDLAKHYDVTNSGSADSAACLLNQAAGGGSQTGNPSPAPLAKVKAIRTIPFSSPMAIIAYDPVIALLKKIGVVSTVGRLTIFHVAAYLREVKSGMLWSDIPGNTAYPVQSPILLQTTDPQRSNSGGMFAAIAYAAQSGSLTAPPRQGDSRLTVIRKSFEAQGELQTHTPFLLQLFLTQGMTGCPMALVYENDALTIKQQLADVRTGVTVMYPDPDLIADNTLFSWTSAGDALTALLQTPRLQDFEKQHGYRTSSDLTDFASYMASRGITVPSLNPASPGLKVVPMPTAVTLQALINMVAPG